ncbi:MAG TPA: DUF4339 domain-containing protein [Vicinamibacterales bacterium]|nr:DUF4339 domain-containing protein [Vicinamibacterales bacterium]
MDAQYYLIGTDGRHYGPLSLDDVRTWLADGRANRYSRARREAEAQWTALREMPEFEQVTRPAHIGSGSSASAPAGAAAREVPDQRYASAAAPADRLDPISCFRRGWYLIASDFMVLGGLTLLVVLTISAITLIPRAGVVVGALVNNLLMAGLYWLFLQRMRGARPSAEEVATAVRLVAPRIVVGGLVQSLVSAPLVVAAVAAASSRTPASLALLLVLLVPSIYLIVGYFFVLPLIVDRQLSVWGALELSRRTVQRHWVATCGLLLASGLLILISSIALGIGLIVTLPLCTAALMFAYTDLFGDV